MVTGNIQDKLLAIKLMPIPCKFSKSDSSIIMIAQGTFTIRIFVLMLCNNMILMKYSSINSTVEVNGHLHTLPTVLPEKDDGCGTELGLDTLEKEKIPCLARVLFSSKPSHYMY